MKWLRKLNDKNGRKRMSEGVAAQLRKKAKLPKYEGYEWNDCPSHIEAQVVKDFGMVRFSQVLAVLATFPDKLEKELRRMWSESDTQMIMAVVDEVLGGVEAT